MQLTNASRIGLSAAIGVQNRKITLTMTLTLILTPDLLCTNNAPFAIGNKHTANSVLCLRISVIFYVINVSGTALRWRFNPHGCFIYFLNYAFLVKLFRFLDVD